MQTSISGVKFWGRSELRETPLDFLLRPPVPLNVTMVTGFHRAPEMISLGEEITQVNMPDLRDALQSARPNCGLRYESALSHA